MEVLIVNGNRHLVNTSMCDKAQDETCQRIIKGYPQDAIVEWDESPTLQDVSPTSLSDILKNINK